MNARQFWYRFGRIFSGKGDLTYAGAAAFMGFHTIKTAAAGAIFPPAILAQAALTAYTSYVAYHGVKSRIRLRETRKELDNHPNEYYFADSEEIVISHKEGLEMLLEKTAEKKWKEWGTVLNAHEEGNKAVIHNIAQIGTAEKLGIIVEKHIPGMMFWNRNLAMDRGFDGMHHYHPWAGSRNYSINTNDRSQPEGWINLLTFNTGGNPEIIGYNNRYTYIPKERSNSFDSKAVLVKATPKDIMEYLGKF
ncbi:MAG: hypothetical protein PHO02_03960 [Candidatus Nanoarchaeia archaeon]|nr:hypothetical protein [Candidatus Nanoarchaeia archaeon]